MGHASNVLGVHFRPVQTLFMAMSCLVSTELYFSNPLKTENSLRANNEWTSFAGMLLYDLFGTDALQICAVFLKS